MSKTAEQLAKELMETGDDTPLQGLDLIGVLAVIEALNQMAGTVIENEFNDVLSAAVKRGCTYFEQEDPLIH